jgi:hypothetical protein
MKTVVDLVLREVNRRDSMNYKAQLIGENLKLKKEIAELKAIIEELKNKSKKG